MAFMSACHFVVHIHIRQITLFKVHAQLSSKTPQISNGVNMELSRPIPFFELCRTFPINFGSESLSLRAAKALTRLRVCAGSYDPSLPTRH